MIIIRVVRPEDEEPAIRDGVLVLLRQADTEFLPPLSRRTDTESLAESGQGTLRRYADAMRQETWLVALERRFVRGVAAGYLRQQELHPGTAGADWHLTTVIVDRAHRRQGIASALYRSVESWAGQCGAATISTRTWGTNDGHLDLLRARGFAEVERLVGDRGPGLDSVVLTYRLHEDRDSQTTSR